MMEDHKDEISEMDSPPHEVGDANYTPVCDPSPKIPSHSRTTTAHTVVSQSQVPHVVLGGHIPISGSSHGPSQGVPHIPNYGASHGTSHGTPYGASHGQSYGPQYGHSYQRYGYEY